MNDTAALLLTLGLAVAWFVLLYYSLEAALLLPAPLLVLGMFAYAIFQSVTT